MTPETIRIIDIWSGRLICFVLTAVRKIGVFFIGARSMKEPVKKILFIKLIEQGATVLSYSAICNAVQMVGRRNVYFCVFKENREILDILNIIPSENILMVRHDNLLIFLTDILKTLFRIRMAGIDATIDMEFFARASAILAFLTGAKKRAGLHRFMSEAPYRGDLMTHRIQYNPYLHASKAYNIMVDSLRLDPNELPLPKILAVDSKETTPQFNPSDEEISVVKTILEREFGQAKGPIILLNPNASDMLPLRKWPEENFIQLARLILKNYPDVRLILTGAPSEADAVQGICNQIGSPRTVNLAGKTTLRQLLVLYTLSHILVTNDSGPGHFAAMTNIHSIVMFGPETPRLFAAIGGRHHIVYGRLACSPCVSVYNHRFSPCRNNRCMQNISVDEVYGQIKQCLSEACDVSSNFFQPNQDSFLQSHNQA
ncbi:MAG: glycosyltransferase family 9 protein [Syntrophales bacterium]